MIDQATYQDNRDASEVSDWLHSEVKALRERVKALEKENEALRQKYEQPIRFLRKAVTG